MPFGDKLTTNISYAMADAVELANANDCPCGVWERDGWFTVSEVAPELIEPDPEQDGWRICAIVDTER